MPHRLIITTLNKEFFLSLILLFWDDKIVKLFNDPGKRDDESEEE